MAAYEYKCSKCNNRTSISRSVSEKDPGYVCQTCNISLIRVYSNIGVAFNGGGFYSTDNKGR